jgi:two-component system sensor histidine kinase YesM
LRSLRSKILWRIVIVATVSFVFSFGFTYYYYKTILEKQIIHDDEIKLRQTAMQLQYMSDDVANFTASLMISDQLQTFFKTYARLDTFEKFAITQEAINYLNNNKGLRKEVVSFALVLTDGKAIWSEAPNDDYFPDHMKGAWYQDFAKSGQTFAFTNTHMMPHSGMFQIKSKTISYIAKVMDIQVSNRQIGQLILNLDYSSFESLLQFGSTGFDAFLWVNDGNHILFENRKRHDPIDLLAFTKAAELQEGKNFLKAQGGYLLVDRFARTNWNLVSFTSKQTLLERSQYVIYLLAVFTLTTTILILLIMMPAIFRITRPTLRLYHAMNAASNGNLQTSVSIRTGDELEKLGDGFNRMIGQLRNHLEESIRYEQEKREMELELLISQINPHFIYNTLNTVIYMAQKQGNEDISRIVGSFINILQDTVKIGQGHSLTPLSEEIRILREYLVIQSYRYPDMFDVKWDMDDETLDCLIPRNLIQPFVENAIFHGICPKDDRGTIRLSAAVRDRMLIITVEDDGVGMEPEKFSTIWKSNKEEKKSHGFKHIGLSNTNKRLEHFFGGNALLRIDSIPEHGTTVRIELPELRGAFQTFLKT